jgi:fumarate reductase subunit C
MSQAVMQAKLWYAQRISAMVLGLCVSIHLVIIFYAIRGGLTAEEILGAHSRQYCLCYFL